MRFEFREKMIMTGVIDFCAERGLCVGNKYLEQKSLHKYIREARGQD